MLCIVCGTIFLTQNSRFENAGPKSWRCRAYNLRVVAPGVGQLRITAVAALTARLASELANLPARSSPKVKGAFVPRRVFHSSANSPFFLPFPSSARPSCLRPRRAPPFPLLGPGPPLEGYNAAREKNASSRLPALMLVPLRNIVSSTVTAVDLHSTMTPPKCLAFQVLGDLFTRLP
jgi:hypothetical protein